VPLLVHHFFEKFNQAKRTEVHGITPEALEALVNYGWPGNIRELENMIERLLVLKRTGTLTLADLPEKLSAHPAGAEEPKEQFICFSDQGINLAREVEQYENRLIVEALRQANGITSKAAQLLQLNRTTLVEKLKRKGFDPKAHSEPFPS
jgi:DNA-binding NtrC family response regulator